MIIDIENTAARRFLLVTLWVPLLLFALFFCGWREWRETTGDFITAFPEVWRGH